MITNAESSTSADKAAIDRSREVHVSALNAGDADGWAACFAGDGVQMPPNFAANAGKVAIEGWTKGFMGLFSCQFKLSADEVQVTGDWAFERSRYDIRLTPRSGGGPMDDNGKYITICQRQPDGNWKIARDIWNSDRPLPGANYQAPKLKSKVIDEDGIISKHKTRTLMARECPLHVTKQQMFARKKSRRAK